MNKTDTLRRALVQRLESLQRAGVAQVPAPPLTLSSQQPAVAEQAPRPVVERETPEPSPAAPRDRQGALAVIEREVAACALCSELAARRHNTVFGVGNPHARVVFMGEAPGEDEDLQGEPFVGKAGKLLDKIIAACTFRREDVYILNTVKCRPPGNRNPKPEEAESCRGFLDRQLEVIQPEYIVCLGAVAAQNLLNNNAPVGRMRGRFHEYGGAKVVVTYHPSYLLREPSQKRKAWDDMKMLLADMGIELPSK